MYQKNRTGLQLASHITSTDPPQPELSVLVRGVYRFTTDGAPLGKITDQLEQGLLSGDTWHEDDPDRLGELTHASDFGDFKPVAEVLLTGSCYTPGGEPLATCPVRFAVGEWEKTLRVIGQRMRKPAALGRTVSAPIPFSTLPLTWAHAYGGPEFEMNPVGTGYGSADDTLPCVEYPDGVQRTTGILARLFAHGQPAGFSPISPEWPQRKRKRGRNYGKKWKAERKPFYSDDFDWTYFNAAPLDQLLPDYLRGDETVQLQNLHPDAEVVEFRLPATQPRVFVKDDQGDVREVTLHLDTLHVFPDDGRVILAWRGLTPCREDDFTDITHIVLDEDPLGEPRPDQHYHDLMAELEEDPLCVKDHVSEDLYEQWKELQKLDPAAEFDPGAAVTSGDGDPVSNLLKAGMGGVRPDVQAQFTEAVAAANAAPAQATAQTLPGVQSLDASVVEAAQKAVPLPPVMTPHFAIGQFLSAIEKLRDGLAAQDLAGFDKGVEKLDEITANPELQKYAPSGAAGSEGAAPGDAGDAGESAGESAAGAAPATDTAADAEREYRRDLTGTDFQGQDLTGEDFTDCKLVGCNFAGATLAGVSFVGANCQFAVFYKAEATGAAFDNADLTLAIADKGQFAYCDFSGARLDDTGFQYADLTSATLDNCHAVRTRFHYAKMADVSAVGMQAEIAMFDGATLTNADFSGATLGKSVFHFVSAVGINLEGADLRGLQAGVDADLTGARCAGADADGSIWRSATLVSADFTDCSLQKSLFADANLVDATFLRADLTRAMMRKAGLEKAKFVTAKLMEAELPKTRCVDTKFINCNLWRTVFFQALLANCDFTGSNINHALRD